MGNQCNGNNIHKVSSYEDYCAIDKPTNDSMIAFLPLRDLSDYDFSSFSARAYLAMKPSLDSGFSLTNFLAELREIKTLFKLVSKRNTILQNIAGLHLNWSFGWKPTIADLRTLWGKLQNFDSAFQKYYSEQGRLLKRHYREIQPIEESSVRNNENPTLDARIVYVDRKVTTQLTATMLYSYRLPTINSQYAKYLALMDYYGLKLNASVIWNALPFSFVVDWFLGIGDFFDQFSEDALDVEIEIVDFCCGLKSKQQATVSFEPNWPANPKRPIMEQYDTVYLRRRMLPSGEVFGPRFSHRYGSAQVLLSASLLLA
jgi:hypothetical protein